MKRLFMILLMLVATSCMYSQDRHSTVPGIYLGPNWANINMNTPDFTSQARTGYQGGVYIRKGDFVYGQAGLEYQVIKTHLSSTSPTLGDSSSSDVSFKSFKIPAYIGLSPLPGDAFANLRIFAGPTLSYFFDVPVNDLDLQLKDLHKVHLDGGVGVGLDILIFTFDAGYNFGIDKLMMNEFDGNANYGFVDVGVRF